MRKVIVQYKLKPGRAAENEQLIKLVYQQLYEQQLAGFHYLTFKQEDGLSFVHLGFSDNEEARTAFGNLPAFKNFTADIKDRCEIPPATSVITDIIGAYNFSVDAN